MADGNLYATFLQHGVKSLKPVCLRSCSGQISAISGSWLSGTRESDGFGVLADKHHLELSLEALAIDKRFTALFTDEEANTALQRLLAAGYMF